MAIIGGKCTPTDAFGRLKKRGPGV